jgi:hypothetical protein
VIHLAVRLSRLGQGDFWYEIERIARNQLLENQFREPERVLAGREAEPGLAPFIRGSFASWARPNDLLGGPDLEGCCTGGGARALFHVLDNGVAREEPDTVAVRMLFSVDTPEAQVRSALPYEGRVRVRLKQAARLKLRRPEGVEAADVTVSVSGGEATSAFARTDGPYLVFDRLPQGGEIEMTFPTPTTTRHETVAGGAYAATWKGNTVVDLTPAGRAYSIYRRDDWRRATTPPLAPWPYGVQTGRVRW